MSEGKKLRLRCPECKAELVVDTATGEILFHKKSRQPAAAGQDFDSLLSGLDEEKSRAEEIFQRERAAMKDRERLLEEKFKEAMERAKEEGEEPPPRPFDLD